MPRPEHWTDDAKAAWLKAHEPHEQSDPPPAAGHQPGEQAGSFGVPEDPLGRAALADDLGLAVGQVEVLDVELEQLLMALDRSGRRSG